MEHELKFAFSDFVKLLKRNKKTLIFSLFAGAFLCFLLAVTRPVNYLLQATFRDKGKTHASIHSFTDMLISSSSSQDNEAISLMKSHFLLSKVVKKLDKQGFISRIEPSHPDIENAVENILAEWAYWTSLQIPILEDPQSELQLKNISYPGEIKQVFIAKMQDDSHFLLSSERGMDFGEGEINVPFQAGDSRFTIVNKENLPLEKGMNYLVVIEPMVNAAALLGKDLVITGDREDKSLLRLHYKSRNRQFAKVFLNTLMATYQNYLEDDHELSSMSQVNYLEKRQKDASETLEQLMEDYVKNVSDDMSKSGFTSLQQEMDFLASNLAANQQKLTEIHLEVKRLGNINCDECVFYDTYTARGDPAIINHLLAEIRALKQQSDSLELALQTENHAQNYFSENFQNLTCLKECLHETENLIASLQGKQKEPFVLKNLEQYPVKSWMNSYLEKEKAWHTAPIGAKKELYEDFKQFKTHFLSYLDTFHRLLKIKESTLQHRLRTPQVRKQEFEGITLDTSRNLYLALIQELNELEAKEKQHRFVIEQLKNPDFEMSSLTALLHDPITHERIANASQLVIQLKDENNRTQKELDRLKEELKLQKVFLHAHIQQMADLLKLKIDLTREKIASIQSSTLDLNGQQISLLKKHLQDYITHRIDNLSQEEKLLEEHQAALHERMSTIPPKWAGEQLLNQSLALQQRFLENLASMVESKNIAKNLEMVQSSPLDPAIPPLHPKPPRLLFFTAFGGLIGLLGASGFLFTRTLMQGIPASLDNLRLAHFHVSGSISPFQGDEVSATTPLIDSDLDTLRRLLARFEQDSPIQKQAKMILIAPGAGPDFSNTLAKLLAKKGQTTLKMQLSFQNASQNEGLLQYIEGKVDFPQIQEMEGFDWIDSGGTSRYSEELLRSPRFMKLLERLKPSYHWIIGVSSMKIPSAEAENLARLFDGVVIVVTEESLQSLISFSHTLDAKNSLTFVTHDTQMSS